MAVLKRPRKTNWAAFNARQARKQASAARKTLLAQQQQTRKAATAQRRAHAAAVRQARSIGASRSSTRRVRVAKPRVRW